MKRWALVTVSLYLISLVSLTAPVLIDCFSWGPESWRMEPGEIGKMYGHWGYWVWIGVSILAQVLLLTVPVAAAEGRPQSRRRLLVPVITSAFLFGLVSLTVIGSLAVAILKDDGLGMFMIFGQENGIWFALALYTLVGWIVWALIFRRFLMKDDPDALVQRLMRWLLRGSILELLIAVPSHVIVRNRGDCCAPGMTFWGIATGLTVMLMSFGPGVCYLFIKRMRRLQGRTTETRQPSTGSAA